MEMRQLWTMSWHGGGSASTVYDSRVVLENVIFRSRHWGKIASGCCLGNWPRSTGHPLDKLRRLAPIGPVDFLAQPTRGFFSPLTASLPVPLDRTPRSQHK